MERFSSNSGQLEQHFLNIMIFIRGSVHDPRGIEEESPDANMPHFEYLSH